MKLRLKNIDYEVKRITEKFIEEGYNFEEGVKVLREKTDVS